MSGSMGVGMVDLADDRVLVAYADGELGMMESIVVEAALERNWTRRRRWRRRC